MPEQQITGFGSSAAPLNRTTKDTEIFELLAVAATFDGTGAAGSFLPTLEIYSDSGVLVARAVADTAISAGSSAEVTFAPFLSRGTAGGLHWGTNVDALAQGLTLTSEGAVATTTDGRGYSVDTSLTSGGPGGGNFSVFTGAGLVTLNADLGDFTLKNFWMTLASNQSQNITVSGPGGFNTSVGTLDLECIGGAQLFAHAPGGTASTLSLIGDAGILISGGGANGVKISAPGHGVSSAAADVEVDLAAGRAFYVRDSGSAARLTVVESTGRTVATIDGGSP